MSLHAEPLTVVARADSGIERFEDLFGKRISYGLPGSGARGVWDNVAGRMGWDARSFAATLELDPDQQPAALCDGRIDAFVFAVGHPAPTIFEATTGCDAVLIPVTGRRISALVEVNPFYFETEIPGGLYRGNSDDVPTFGVGATLVTRADVGEDVVATLVGSVFGRIETLRSLDPVLAGLDPTEMATSGLTAPLHPAAESYYRGKGWNE
jgi:TRAP transporter TAXI family solute receptor